MILHLFETFTPKICSHSVVPCHNYYSNRGCNSLILCSRLCAWSLCVHGHVCVKWLCKRIHMKKQGYTAPNDQPNAA